MDAGASSSSPAQQSQPHQQQHSNREEEGLPVFEVRDPTLFANPDDYRILLNDWPYGFEPGITHMVVWLKTRIPAGPEGFLTEESKALVQGFVEEVFVGRLEGRREGPGDGEGKREGADGGRRERGEDRVMWFKNWTGLQSVKGLDHFHVLVRGAGEEVVREWIGDG